ncbi:MAG: ribosome-associated translation inhibitor RaiA [Oscillospiraceae bacterium]
MKVKMLGRKVNLKTNFIDMAEKRMQKLDKFFDEGAEGQVTVTVGKDRQTAEVTVKSKGFYFRAEKSAFDMETAFNDAVDLIVKQIVKNKDKLGAHVKRSEVEIEEQTIDAVVDTTDYSIAREKRFLVEPLKTDEAILQMEMLGHSFFIFQDIDSGELNVIYKRRDGQYGLLIPEV